ncbi:MAG: hypothetical protein PHC95_08930 [Parabacteroides sp.]|nr:hypothetical protein [Parabacteroides sp.]
MNIATNKTTTHHSYQTGMTSPLMDNCYTANDLIDAYKKGEQSHAMIADGMIYMGDLMKRSCEIIKTFYDANLRGKGCASIFMRIILDHTDFVIAIDKDLYFNEDYCRSLYKSAYDITRAEPQIMISFIPVEKACDINEESLAADTYIKIL